MSNNLKEEIYLFVSTLPDWQKILSAYLLGFIDDEVQKETVIENALKTLLFGSNLIEENLNIFVCFLFLHFLKEILK